MLVEVSKNEYRRCFSADRNPYISENFITLNEQKQDKVIHLMNTNDRSIGLLVGLKDGVLRSPFSAPFGGFHYKREYVSYDKVLEFLTDLKEYVVSERLKQVIITLPPDIYQVNMNSKMINAFIKSGYTMELPDLNNHVDLKCFEGKWDKGEVAQNCRRAVSNGLKWSVATNMDEYEEVYGVVLRNREGLGRKIHMTLEDILKVKDVFPIDFFLVREPEGNCIGGAVLYRGHESIVQGIFMGSDLEKRNLGVIDHMYLNVYNYYKELGFDYLDMGISSFDGEPNIGLLRFKETHKSYTSLRYTFTWKP